MKQIRSDPRDETEAEIETGTGGGIEAETGEEAGLETDVIVEDETEKRVERDVSRKSEKVVVGEEDMKDTEDLMSE